MTDPFAPSPSQPSLREWVHWIITDIPGGTGPGQDRRGTLLLYRNGRFNSGQCLSICLSLGTFLQPWWNCTLSFADVTIYKHSPMELLSLYCSTIWIFQGPGSVSFSLLREHFFSHGKIAVSRRKVSQL